MNGLNFYLRFSAILIFAILHVYWRISEKGVSKALEFKNPLASLFEKSFLSYAQFIVVLQLAGLSLFPKPQFPVIIQILAILICLKGLIICIVAHKTLGKNWTNAKDYKNSTTTHLVSSGIYGYIRHPIYLGLILVFTGSEMLANSYLIILLPLLYLWFYNQAKKEEGLLLVRFGKQYESYLSKTKMFLPYLI